MSTEFGMTPEIRDAEGRTTAMPELESPALREGYVRFAGGKNPAGVRFRNWPYLGGKAKLNI